jgi:hypothetical protein
VGSATALGTLIASGVISTQSRVVIPVGGMIRFGAMQATGLALHRLRGDAETARDAIEARMSLGLPAREAFLPHQRLALRPAIDSTKVVGLISLPGAMIGLILAGVDPLTAIRYQIVVMYMLLTALATARLAEHALFDHAHRLVPLIPPSCRDHRHSPAPTTTASRHFLQELSAQTIKVGWGKVTMRNRVLLIGPVRALLVVALVVSRDTARISPPRRARHPSYSCGCAGRRY